MTSIRILKERMTLNEILFTIGGIIFHFVTVRPASLVSHLMNAAQSS
jgi:hypothetical protein